MTSSWPRSGDEIAGTFVRTDAIARARAAKARPTGGEAEFRSERPKLRGNLRRDERVVVLAPDGPGGAHGGEGLRVVDVLHHGLFGSPGAALRAREDPRRVLGLVRFAREVARAIDREGPTSIVAHWLFPSAAAVRSYDRSTPLEAIAHGADVRLLRALPRPAARRFIEWLCVDDSTTIRAVSSSLAERLADLAPSIARHLFVAPMPLAVDDPIVRARVVDRAARLEVGDRPLHVVAARLVADKRIERALEHARLQGGSITIVGCGPRRDALEHAARGMRARFTGALPHEEALAWIAAADVVLAPIGSDEGEPTVIREACALGVPVAVFG